MNSNNWKTAWIFPIKPPKLNEADILSTFENIHLYMKAKTKDEESYHHLKNELIHLAQCYVSSYRPTPADLKNHHILKNIRNNKIIVLRSDKFNGVVIMDRIIYKIFCLNIINDQNRFKLLSDDPTLFIEAKLQRLLRKLRKQGSLDDKTYQHVVPRGSQPARFYGLPMLHKQRDLNSSPPLRRIVSSVNTYNYNLAKYLCSLLNPLIPDDYITKDSFSFVYQLSKLTAMDVSLYLLMLKASSLIFL